MKENLGPVLTNTFGDAYFYEINGNAFNQVGSKALYQSYFGESLGRQTQLYIVVGTDSGLLVDFVKAGVPDGSRYIFTEPEAVRERLEHEGRLGDLPPSVAIVAPEDLWEKAKDYKVRDYIYLNSVVVVDALCAVDGRLSVYRELSKTIKDEVQQTVWNIRKDLGCQEFIRRQLENLSDNRHAAVCFKGLFKGKTAVLLAGGPSLDDFLPWVKANRDSLVVLAVSRIARQLLKQRLAPDFIFSVDPQTTSFDVSREMLELWEDTVFIHSYHVSPQLLGQWRGRSYYLGPRFPWKNGLNSDNLGSSGPTVTNAALHVAVDMGFRQVVLMGVDLCYGATGITHAAGSNESLAGPRLSDTLAVANNEGGTSETGIDYAAAIAILGLQAGNARQKGCRFVNPAPRAARVAHVDHVCLAEIAVGPSPAAVLERFFAENPPEESSERLRDCAAVLSELDKAAAQLLGIRKLAWEGLKNHKKLLKHGSRPSKINFSQRFEKIEKRINSDYTDLSQLVRSYGIKSFLKIVKPHGEERESLEESGEVLRVYYQSYLDSLETVSGLIEDARTRVASRMEEDGEHPDAARLAEQWRRDDQCGRVFVWQTRHPETYGRLSAGDKTLLDSLIGEYREKMSETETGQMKKVRRFRGLDGVQGRARSYFQLKDRDALERLAGGLAVHPDKAAAAGLKALADGYRAELEGRNDEAIGFYHDLVGEDFNALTEEALKRILSLSLRDNNFESALLALDCLANASVVYKPKLAELLRMTGHYQAAADAYIDYIEVIPKDLTALLKLGQVYREMGEEGAARQVFGLILEQDPEYEAARALLVEEAGLQ